MPDGQLSRRAGSNRSTMSPICACAGLDVKARECVSDAGALKGLVGHRFQARWAMVVIEPQLPLFTEGAVVEEEIQKLIAPP